MSANAVASAPNRLTIYCASRTEQENLLVRRKIQSLFQEFPQLQFIGLHPQGLPVLRSEKPTLAIINVFEWKNAETEAIEGLRNAGYRGPILVIASQAQEGLLAQVRALAGVVVMQKPFEPRELVGVVRKMLLAPEVAQQKYRRFATDQGAEISLTGQEGIFQARMCNMSKGGACLETWGQESGGLAPLQTGDMVRVKVELKDLNRIYTLQARVVWAVPTVLKSSVESSISFGVQFVGTPDVTQTALEIV